MSSTREQRVDGALTQLVQRTLPLNEDEDPASVDERLDNALSLAQETLNSEDVPAVVSDVNHISELIKAKLLREHDTSEIALRFNNLFTRLVSQPVLTQKWAILYLLHQISDSTSHTSPIPNAPYSPKRAPTLPFNEQQSPHFPLNTSTGRRELHVSPTIEEGFSRRGLQRLPTSQEKVNARQDSALRINGMPANRESSPIPYNLSKSSGDTTPPESALLRDLPFTLQGLSSTNMVFSSHDTLKLPPTLPVPIIALLHSLAEPSLLYKSLSTFLETSEGSLIGQSMRASIGVELRSYLGLVATLESQIRRALSMLDESQPKRGLGKAGVTLRRCVIWTREATMGLRLLNVIVEESKSRKGGQLISLIHSFASSHGDPFVGGFAERLLAYVTRPFYDMLRMWIYDGELSDPWHEFFALEQHPSETDDSKGHATSVWEDKYALDSTQIPSIITEEFARKVFLIGKSLNFIRTACGDAAWVESYSKSTSRQLQYGDAAARAVLETSIDEAYKTVMARLVYLMNSKFKLLEHLTALKKYLLLGQGDFVALLMESLAGNLDRPANSQYRHTLTAQLEHAIRNSNAQYDSPDVLRRLDARMLELSHGEIGWDVFTLEYKVDAPVDVIVTAYASKQYLKVFNFLWRVKRVEFALGSTWRRCMTGARGVLGGVVADSLGREWKVARCVVAEMIHFVNQLQYYILFEVIEASWSQLVKALTKPDATLDDLIQAHARYLKAITRKGLLGGSSSANIDFTSQLHELLKTMLAYRDAVAGLHAISVAEATKVADRSARIERRTRAGKWGLTERDDTSSPLASALDNAPLLPGLGGDTSSTLPALRKRLDELGAEFRARVCGLLGDLAYQPDTDMRFLGVVMNFNDVYKIVKRSRRKGVPATAQKEKGKEKVREANGTNASK